MHKFNICAISYNQRYRVRPRLALNSDDKREHFVRVHYVTEQLPVDLDRYIKFAVKSENYLIPIDLNSNRCKSYLYDCDFLYNGELSFAKNPYHVKYIFITI